MGTDSEDAPAFLKHLCEHGPITLGFRLPRRLSPVPGDGRLVKGLLRCGFVEVVGGMRLRITAAGEREAKRQRRCPHMTSRLLTPRKRECCRCGWISYLDGKKWNVFRPPFGAAARSVGRVSDVREPRGLISSARRESR